MIHYDRIDLVDDNMLLVDVDCPRCGASCRCEDGCDDVAFYDLTTLLHNIAVAGALAHAWALGSRNGAEWYAGMAVRKTGP
jgi:hypothetical protein